jgi:GTP-binding protein EngB required for normal cell division
MNSLIYNFDNKNTKQMSVQSELNYVNICLVGCVSAGKSTILNAFFGQDYAQCKIKRTTMMPNKFIETDDNSLVDSFDIINTKIINTNKQIYTQTEEKNILNLDDYGVELTFYVGKMEMNIKNKICIYDIPGLNDARTKNIYYEYLKNNFHKFNIILFVVDIFSGLNTSDEMDILKFLSENIKMHETKSNKNIHMLTIVNKADDMQLNNNGTLEVLGELGEMFGQVTTTVNSEFAKHKIKDKLLGCIPICGLDAHLYRMIKKFKDISKLSGENILRIGINEEGSKFRKYKSEEQKTKVQNKIKDIEFVEDMIKLSGFAQIEVCLDRYIGQKGNIMVSENVLLDYSKIHPMTIDNIIHNMIQRINLLNYLRTSNKEKYDEEMKIQFNQFNKLISQKINTMNNPMLIKQYYDREIQELTCDQNIKNIVTQFFNSYNCPKYLTDRILELVNNDFKEKEVKIEDFIKSFTPFYISNADYLLIPII